MDSAIERIAKQRIFKMSALFQIFRRRGLVVLGTVLFLASFSQSRSASMDDPLVMPEVGSAQLKVIAPDLLELALITTKGVPPARPTIWNFIAVNGQYALPSVGKFVVTADGLPVVIQSVGFRRRPIYAPLRKRDLRIGNYLYLKLVTPVQDGQNIQVLNPDGTLWGTDVLYSARAEAQRLSPAVHVNQQGYVPNFPKKAYVGYYLGTFGELDVPAGDGFKIVKNGSGEVVYGGNLTLHADAQDVNSRYTFTPAPYQKVYEADFSNFTTPGEYRLYVPRLGTSSPFRIDEGVAACFARTYALGLYHQRCGTDNELPFTRFVHDVCHAGMAEVPTATYTAVNKELAEFSADYANNPRHTAPQLSNVVTSLYPFVNTGKIDVSGGHHDAGDYSKYTINSAQLIHTLIFAVDNFRGVSALDNLGLPESGDGISDLLQEAKWEADFLSKMQDADGGFYFLVYPRNRAYEDNVLPDRGDPQVVFPKNTAVTAAAVAALAQTASSPLFKEKYPEVAASYLAKARKGWDFLQNAFSRFGRDGSYQKISHYGNEFMHDDEIAWAAAELFLATGDHAFESELINKFDPSNRATLRDGWVRLWEGYGCAIRSYAFGARSHRISDSELNSDYRAKCEAQIFAAADDQARFSREHAYGSSFPDPNKPYRTAGWYFSVDQTFDIATASQLDPRAEYLDAIVKNMNYEGGGNPLNVSFLTGIGSKRQREIVHQYALNDRRALPPSGIPLGNIQKGFQDLSLYPSNELVGLTFPNDYAASSPYAPYDIWADTYNLTTEFVNPQQAHSLASMAYLMAMTGIKDQSWKPLSGQISFGSSDVLPGTAASASLSASGLDLSSAQIVWEGRGADPFMGNLFQVTPEFLGPYWVEAEALLPDGRRIFASSEFNSVAGHHLTVISASQLSISGVAGQTFTLQTSNDLLNWRELITDVFTGDTYEFTDDSGSGEPVRFYRAVAAP